MIFPNPVKSVINIDTPAPADIELFNTSGQLLIRKSSHQGELDISKFERGVYFLRIILDDHIYMNKIIKE